MHIKIIKWVSLPMMLIASLFSHYAASYEVLAGVLICLGALFFVQRAIRSKEYFWGAGLVAIAVLFSPLLLVAKIFLTIGLCCGGTFATLLVVFRAQPVRT